MKYIPQLIFITLIGFISSKSSRANYPIGELPTSYKVYKIDSINNWYLIYARKGDSLYKIVSKKMSIENCNRIRIHKSYEFRCHSCIYGDKIAEKTILPQYTLLVTCFSFDDSTNICLERDSINDLHYADNIKGLCFIK
jgi:hypothetical protein